jgi:hypothetical protein
MLGWYSHFPFVHVIFYHLFIFHGAHEKQSWKLFVRDFAYGVVVFGLLCALGSSLERPSI